MSFINRVLMAAVVAAGLWSPTAQAQDKTLRIGFQKLYAFQGGGRQVGARILAPVC